MKKELSQLAKELLQTIYEEDIEYDYRNGGMYREKNKAKYYQGKT